MTVGDWEPATKNSVLPSDRLSAIASNTTARLATGTGMFSVMIDRVWVNRSAKRYCRAAVYTASAMPMTVDRIVDSSTS